MKQNSTRIRLGGALQKHSKGTKQALWRRASEAVLASRKNRPEVNLSSISKNSKEGSKIVVPGKVLGSGTINHKVTVAAISFSGGAKAKILAAGGQCLLLSDFMQSEKSVEGVLILG
ncbi:MAG: 50S ribosomal protein L18e [Nitrososphaerales archaeon]